MTGFAYDAVIVLTVAGCTFLTRLFPFALFGRKQSPHPLVTYIGKILPSAVIAVLVVYCLKTMQFTSLPAFAPQCIGIAVVAALHVWKRNFLLSIGAGTVCYMALVQLVFR
jgi:branched-subunit amino acid transport protein AzlD